MTKISTCPGHIVGNILHQSSMFYANILIIKMASIYTFLCSLSLKTIPLTHIEVLVTNVAFVFHTVMKTAFTRMLASVKTSEPHLSLDSKCHTVNANQVTSLQYILPLLCSHYVQMKFP